VKSTALVIAAVVVTVFFGWKAFGVIRGESLAAMLEDTLNEYPNARLGDFQGSGRVESVECDDEVAAKLPGMSFHDCLVRYEDGTLQPWCVAKYRPAPTHFAGGPGGCSTKT
jgi:hypothetical protein